MLNSILGYVVSIIDLYFVYNNSKSHFIIEIYFSYFIFASNLQNFNSNLFALSLVCLVIPIVKLDIL